MDNAYLSLPQSVTLSAGRQSNSRSMTIQLFGDARHPRGTRLFAMPVPSWVKYSPSRWLRWSSPTVPARDYGARSKCRSRVGRDGPVAPVKRLAG